MQAIPLCSHSFINMRDIYDDAAVIITDFALSCFARSTIPTAVKGFTKRAAPCSSEIASFSGIQLLTSVTQYSAKAPPI